MNHSTAGFCVTCILATVLAGCGRESPTDSSQAGQPAPAVSARSAEGDATLKRMVSGVSASKDESLVDLKFELKARPQVGKPLDIDIALLPKVAADSMQVTYISADALPVQPVKVPADYRNVQAGNIYRHQVSVIPKDIGVYYVSAVVMIDSETGSLTRTFAIPVLVGEPPDPVPASGTEATH
jgi:hypothetical protein